MQARDVRAHVETLLGEPAPWSVKATLAGNLEGPTPRFVRVARGRYGVPPPPNQHRIDVRDTCFAAKASVSFPEGETAARPARERSRAARTVPHCAA